MKTNLIPEQYEALRRLDTCTVSNAIETFDVRRRNAIPAVAERIREKEHKIIAHFRAGDYSLDKLRKLVREKT